MVNEGDAAKQGPLQRLLPLSYNTKALRGDLNASRILSTWLQLSKKEIWLTLRLKYKQQQETKRRFIVNLSSEVNGSIMGDVHREQKGGKKKKYLQTVMITFSE